MFRLTLIHSRLVPIFAFTDKIPANLGPKIEINPLHQQIENSHYPLAKSRGRPVACRAAYQRKAPLAYQRKAPLAYQRKAPLRRG
jgi:hypothetical protein